MPSGVAKLPVNLQRKNEAVSLSAPPATSAARQNNDFMALNFGGLLLVPILPR
jgi:hypothetical protein